MTATTPYLVRAIHEWCTDQHLTPYLLVDATLPDVAVPMSLVSDGSIVMNLDFSAVLNLEMGNEWILFSARFGGKQKDVSIPISAVRAIYAKENGQGCVFPALSEQSPQASAAEKLGGKSVASVKSKPGRPSSEPKSKPKPASKTGKPTLKLVD